MIEHRIRPRHERERLERYAERGCRISAYMLEHGVSFPDAVEALHASAKRSLVRGLPGPAPVPEDDPP
jgi:hypothetical protein